MIMEGIFFLFYIETICCDSSSSWTIWDGSDKGHNVCFYAELTEIIPNYQ